MILAPSESAVINETSSLSITGSQNMLLDIMFEHDFGTKWKRATICDFLLVRHRNLGPILHRFGDIAVFCAPDPTPIPP